MTSIVIKKICSRRNAFKLVLLSVPFNIDFLSQTRIRPLPYCPLSKHGVNRIRGYCTIVSTEPRREVVPLSLIFSFISNRETFASAPTSTRTSIFGTCESFSFYYDRTYVWRLFFFFSFLIVGRVNGTYILVYGYTTSGEKGERKGCNHGRME